MSKKSLIIGFIVVLIGAIFILSTSAFAEDNLDALFKNESSSSGTIIFGDDPVSSNPSSTSSNEIETNTTTKNTTTKNTTTKNTTAKNTTNNTNTTNKNTAANNISGYNTTNNTPESLSKAGLEDSIPTMILVVIFAISAIYAYKKINDYKNV